jgi:hypothetical protein
MPGGSYALVFDGGTTPKRGIEVLDIVQRDAVWQAALELSYMRGYLL